MPVSLGENIRTFRQQARLSQEKVAELVGVSRQAVTKWEKDQSEPSCENLLRLAEVLGTTVPALTALPAERPKTFDWQGSLRFTGVLTVLWLGLWLAGRLAFGIREDHTVLGWLFGWQSRVYLFGWLLSSRLYWYAMVAACGGGLLNRRLFALTASAGFFLGWAAGELLGPRRWMPQAGVEYHYGWATWLGIWLLSLILGLILQKRERKNRP